MSYAHAETSRSGDGWHSIIGIILGSLSALITFIVIMIAACDSAGWVVGIALGWIPALIGATIVCWLVWLLWLPIIAGIIYVVSTT